MLQESILDELGRTKAAASAINIKPKFTYIGDTGSLSNVLSNALKTSRFLAFRLKREMTLLMVLPIKLDQTGVWLVPVICISVLPQFRKWCDIQIFTAESSNLMIWKEASDFTDIYSWASSAERWEWLMWRIWPIRGNIKRREHRAVLHISYQ